MIQKVTHVNSDSQKSLGQKWIQGEADDFFFAAKLKVLFYFILFSFSVVKALGDKPSDWLFPYLQSTSSNLKTVEPQFLSKHLAAAL